MPANFLDSWLQQCRGGVSVGCQLLNLIVFCLATQLVMLVEHLMRRSHVWSADVFWHEGHWWSHMRHFHQVWSQVYTFPLQMSILSIWVGRRCTAARNHGLLKGIRKWSTELASMPAISWNAFSFQVIPSSSLWIFLLATKQRKACTSSKGHAVVLSVADYLTLVLAPVGIAVAVCVASMAWMDFACYAVVCI